MEQQVLIDALNYPGVSVGVHLAPIGGAKVVTEILNVTPILAGATTTIADCAAIDLHVGGNTLTITVETTFNGAATQGIRIHSRTSRNNVDYDTEDWDTWLPNFTAGATIRQTKVYDTSPAYIEFLVENLDLAQAVTNTRIFATVG